MSVSMIEAKLFSFEAMSELFPGFNEGLCNSWDAVRPWCVLLLDTMEAFNEYDEQGLVARREWTKLTEG